MPKKLPHHNQILELSKNKFPVVGVGASAGGLRAFKEFVTSISEDSGMAYVLVQHLDPTHESLLSEILQKSTPVPVLEITDDIKVKPDHIYIIPSNKMLLATDGVLKLSQRPAPERNKKNHPIDLFFKSLAIIHESHSIGVVLSGTANDGTQGLRDIKDKGGLTFAQEEDSAEWPQMPNNAINAGVVDFILPPSEIPEKLLQMLKTESNFNNEGSDDTEKNIGDFQKILSLIRGRQNIDFTYYKESTIRRRILRRMVLSNYKSLELYFKFLQENTEEIDVLFQDLLIPVTTFFRDNEIFTYFTKSILPLIIEKEKESQPIRIWIAGCSTGQEAYSLAICIHEYFLANNSNDSKRQLKSGGFNGNVQIFASDISEPAILKARKGWYKKEELENVSSERLEKYFDKFSSGFQVKKEVRESCVFAVHNFLKDPPFGNINLISCRNVLIYLQPYLQKKAFSTFHYALKPEGFLLIGKSESVGSASGFFTALDKKYKFFKRKSVRKSLIIPGEGNNQRRHQAFLASNNIPVKRTDFQRTADELLLKKYVPASVVINEAMDIVLFRGSTSRYLEQQSGEPSHNLMKMAMPGLAFELRNILHKVKKDGKVIQKSLVYTHRNGDRQTIVVEAMPLPKVVEPHYLIIFQPSVSAVKKQQEENYPFPQDEKDLRIQELERELTQSREDMRGITEDQEAVNEELQSANEELLSGSEELQSLNEELETSKEELQSTNEELTVVNQELSTLNNHLTEERDFANATINTTRDPLIVLDGSLKVVTANKSFYEVFRGKASTTEGKMFYELENNQWDIPQLRQLLESVLPKDEKVEDYEVIHTFQSVGERSLILNASKIVRDNGKNNLILLSIEDVTERKTIAKKLKESLNRYEEMIYSSPSLIAILEGPCYTLSIANDAFLKHLGNGHDKIGASYLDVAPEIKGQDLSGILKGVYNTGIPHYLHEIPISVIVNDKPEILYYNFTYQAQRNSAGRIEGVAILATEVTVQAELHKAIQESESRFHQMADLTPEKIICADSTGKVYYFNKSWLNFTGLNLESLVKKGWEYFMHPEEIQSNLDNWNQAMKSGENFEKELRLQNKNGDYKWHLSRAVPVRDENGMVKMWIGAITQIHKLKEEEERKENFLKLASHELKTPITSIKGYTQLLLERLRETKEKLPESIPFIPALQRIDSQITRLTRLISEMLDITRVQENKLELKWASFSLNDMVEEILQDIQYSSTAAKFKVNHREQLTVEGDRDRISQVLINLVTNAIKYSSNDQNIEVNIYQDENMASVSIKDHGIGINLRDQKNIFEKFFRVSGKDEQTYSGLGIGLYLSKEIILRHNGTIKVTSEKGEGSLFTFSLPL